MLKCLASCNQQDDIFEIVAGLENDDLESLTVTYLFIA